MAVSSCRNPSDSTYIIEEFRHCTVRGVQVGFNMGLGLFLLFCKTHSDICHSRPQAQELSSCNFYLNVAKLIVIPTCVVSGAVVGSMIASVKVALKKEE